MSPSDDFFRAYGRKVSDDWELLPTTFMIPPVGRSCEEVSILPKIEYTGRGWAVCDHSFRLSKRDRSFVYQSLPSNRTEAYIKDTVFPTPEAALEFFMKHWVPQSEDFPDRYWMRRWFLKHNPPPPPEPAAQTASRTARRPRSA